MEEGYSNNWKHAKIHADLEAEEFHSDGVHEIREYIQNLKSERDQLKSVLHQIVDSIKETPPSEYENLIDEILVWSGEALGYKTVSKD